MAEEPVGRALKSPRELANPPTNCTTPSTRWRSRRHSSKNMFPTTLGKTLHDVWAPERFFIFFFLASRGCCIHSNRSARDASLMVFKREVSESPLDKQPLWRNAVGLSSFPNSNKTQQQCRASESGASGKEPRLLKASCVKLSST